MRPLIICFFCLFLAFGADAQREFAPIGATWYYGFYDSAFGIPLFQGYEEMSYDRDTTIDNIACKVLTRERVGEVDDQLVSYTVEEKMIYQKGYQIFARSGETFVKIFDFGLTHGETMTIDFLDCPREYAVDSVYYEEIDGEDLKNIRLADLNSEEYHWVNEKFGSINHYLFAGESSCLPAFGEVLTFRCYEDDEFAHFQADTIACDEYSNITQLVELEKTGIAIHPNPIDDLLLLKNTSGEAYDLTVFNLDGHLMYQSFAVTDGRKEIDCAEWNPGTYVVQLKMGEDRAFQKLLKTN